MTIYQQIGKRVLDVGGALALTPVLGIAVLVFGPIIKIEDGGPVFYASDRRGRHGKPFRMYKFRTMKVNAPDLRNSDGSTFNSENDSRVTRVGGLLRKTSMDELPQIMNVLSGDMSFVGPRPDIATRNYSELSATEQFRLRVRPGVTGLTQALFRNSIEAKSRYKIDASYAEQPTVSGDFKILLATVSAVIGRKNIHTRVA